MHRLGLILLSFAYAGCATHPPEAPERWLTRSQSAEHYHHAELAPVRRMREVPETVRGEAVLSLQKVHFRRLSDEEYHRYGGSQLERLPFQSAYLLRAVRPAHRRYRLEVYRDHLEHRGHVEPPATVSSVTRAGGLGDSHLEKTAVVYVDSRPPERLNVDYLRSR
ncbi:MAG: hypothetical protein EOP84_09220 [Verrucomicrobiaceae bacterium]|nr:MAG: hypothetical protein EOP84_09220 [Verrucomicrobiaceae bacterium]